MKKSKKVLIIILIILLVLLTIGGIFAYLYIKTDMFKTNEQLFWKYMSKNTEISDILFAKTDSKNEKQSYTQKAKLEFETENKEMEMLNNIVLNSETIYNSNTNKAYSQLLINFKQAELFKFECLKNGNTYAIRNDEIANGYIAVENNELKQLAQNIGVDSNNIPNQIKNVDFSKISEITNEEKQHIIDTYSKVIKNNIGEDKYKKIENAELANIKADGKVTAYAVSLTEKEYQKLKIDILETLKTDSITLNLIVNKMKVLNLPENYASINELNSKIGELIEQLKTEQVLEEEYLTVTVYACDGETLNTQIKIGDKTTIDIACIKEESKIIINQTSTENNNILGSLEKITIINKNTSEEEYFMLNIEDSEKEALSVEIKKEKLNSGYKKTASVNMFGITAKYTEENSSEVLKDIPNIKESTNINLNSLEKEKLNILLNKLQQRINTIIEEKKKMIYNVEQL